MYTILLVDDEILELETLRDYVNWKDLGIKVVGTAKNGREALEKVKELNPDIVITDVKMPIMDGLEFSKLVREFCKNLKVIFLSGYDEFKFIKTAMDVEASGYLLKPLDISELKVLIEKVKRKLEEESLKEQSVSELKKKYFTDLIFGDNLAEKLNLAQNLLTLDNNFSLSYNSKFNLALLKIDNSGQLLKNNKQETKTLSRSFLIFLQDFMKIYYPTSVILSFKDFEYCLIFNSLEARLSLEELHAQLQLKLRDSFGTSGTLIYNSSGGNLFDLSEFYLKTLSCLELRFYMGKGSLIKCDDYKFSMPNTESKNVDVHKAKLLAVLDQFNTENSCSILEALFAAYKNEFTPIHIIYQNTFDIINSLYESIKAIKSSAVEHFDRGGLWPLITACDTLEDLHLFTIKHVTELMRNIQDNTLDRDTLVVNKIIEILDSSYSKQLAIEDIAKSVYLSPNYIRGIFKEKTGETILDYLTKIRIKKATELLMDKSLKVHEVSIKVGYENVSYFCSIFGKYKGITPNEYRKKFL